MSNISISKRSSTKVKSTDGYGTVLINSSTIFNSFDSERVFTKGNGAGFESDHTGMLKKDESTSIFIGLLIDGSYLECSDTELYDEFRITIGYGGLL